MRRVLLSMAVLVLAAALLVSSAGAVSWSGGSTSGTWITCTRESFSANSDGGRAEWVASAPNFTGYSAQIEFLMLTHPVDFWDVQSAKEFEVLLNFSDVYISLRFECLKNLGGLLTNYWVYYATSANKSDFTGDWWNWWSVHWSSTHWDVASNWFTVYVYDAGSTTAVIDVYQNTYMSNVRLIHASYTVDASWWAGMNISLSYVHYGRGAVSGLLADVVTCDDPYDPDLPSSWEDPEGDNWFGNLVKNLMNAVGKVLPKAIGDLVSSFSSWGYWLTPMLGAVSGIVVAVLPWLPYILGFYVLDAGITSVATGSFAPIGLCFTTLMNLLAGVVHALVSIGSAIWSFIKFW